MKRGTEKKAKKEGTALLILIYLLYLLLCMPIIFDARASLNGVQCAAEATVAAGAVSVGVQGVLAPAPGGTLPRFVPRYGSVKRRKLSRRTAKLKPMLQMLLDCAHWQHLEVIVRLGTDQADRTAVLCGAVRAAVEGITAMGRHIPPLVLHVQPDFASPCFAMTARCIFFVRAGDIMFAAVRAAVKKTRKEGLKWISIPSRA